MEKQAILHIPMSQYAYGLDDTHMVFRLRSARNDLQMCTLIYGDRACRRTPVDYYRTPMHIVASDKLFDWWEVTLHTEIHRVCYAFELTGRQGERTFYYGDLFNDRLTDDRSAYFQLPFNHRADRVSVPAWMKDAIVYNIFPDSYATGKRFITGKPTECKYQDQITRGKLGGSIRGIIENLDYIKELGFNCVYLNPIFVAGEYHKYDLIDYYHIDPAFGTDGDFRDLVSSAHAMGIRVMIDGVFNHCGWHFFAFEDVKKNGRASRYWDWFYALSDPVIVPDNMDDYPNYECFGYERMMPKLATDHPEVQDYFCKVGAYWVREYDIDGWRLDVASEIHDGFWRAFRQAVKAVKPDCALIGEVWESAGHWLDGSMFDSTMNYDFRKHAASFFASEHPDAADFNHRATDMLMRYRKPVVAGQLNLLDSHDVSRFLSLCQGDHQKHQLAVLMQMTFVGMPCVFYGDELAVEGILEDEYRHPMPWGQVGCSMFSFYQKAISLRNAEPALRSGDFVCEIAEGPLYRYSRRLEEQVIIIMMNVSDLPCSVTVDQNILWQSGLSNGMLDAYGFVVMKR